MQEKIFLFRIIEKTPKLETYIKLLIFFAVQITLVFLGSSKVEASIMYSNNMHIYSKKIESYFKGAKIRAIPVYFLQTIIDIAVYYVENNKYDEAIACLEKGITAYPEAYELYYNLGVVYLKKNELLQAKKNFEKCISIKPNFVYAHLNLGSLHGMGGNFDKAIKHYLKVLTIDPSDETALYNLQIIYKLLGRADMTEKPLNQLKLEYTYPTLY